MTVKKLRNHIERRADKDLARQKKVPVATEKELEEFRRIKEQKQKQIAGIVLDLEGGIK
jgi:hypothetical protein